MSNIVLVGANCEAYGHPTQCSEPANGSVSSSSSSNVTLNGEDVYFHSRADMSFSSHAHDYSVNLGCHNNQSHSIDPEDTHNLTLNGSPIVIESDEGTDPGSGGRAIFTDSGGNETFKLLE
jgi:hypothetical protein